MVCRRYEPATQANLHRNQGRDCQSAKRGRKSSCRAGRPPSASEFMVRRGMHRSSHDDDRCFPGGHSPGDRSGSQSAVARCRNDFRHGAFGAVACVVVGTAVPHKVENVRRFRTRLGAVRASSAGFFGPSVQAAGPHSGSGWACARPHSDCIAVCTPDEVQRVRCAPAYRRSPAASSVASRARGATPADGTSWWFSELRIRRLAFIAAAQKSRRHRSRQPPKGGP